MVNSLGDLHNITHTYALYAIDIFLGTVSYGTKWLGSPLVKKLYYRNITLALASMYLQVDRMRCKYLS